MTELREGIDEHLPDSAAAQEWVVSESGVDPEAGRQLVAYIEEGKRVLGLTPSKNRVVAERFFRRQRRDATRNSRAIWRPH